MKSRYEDYKVLREQGKTYREIADIFGITKDAVADYCQMHGLGYTDTERQVVCTHNKGKLLVDWNEKVKVKYNGAFKLVSIGDANEKSERYLIVECLSCGTQKRVSSQSFKGECGKHGFCEKCNANHRDITHSAEYIKKKKTKEVERQIKKRQDQLIKEKRKSSHKLKQNQIGFKFCGDCGLSIILSNRQLCDDCLAKHQLEIRKEQNRNKEINRRTKEQNCKRDKGITLKKVYIRDNGICYLCGRVCDWNDYKIVNDAFIVGGSYPTIEHVLALCNGGTHTWDNIKLACHACNTKKGRRLLAS